ncbi:hypothetical protein KKC91_06305 [bacterium]|nr:hypothetical protein [bacterium]
MKIAALILGILGGLAGIVGAIMALLAGGVGAALEAEGASTIVTLGWVAFPLALLGIVGGSLAIAKPKVAGILMLISGIGGFVAVSMGYIIAGPLLIIGGILGLIAKKEDKRNTSS